MRTMVIASVLLSGCAMTPQPDAEHRAVYLVCGGATRVDINLDGRTAVLHDTDGERLILKRTPSSLGTRYEGGGVWILRSNDLYVYHTRDGQSLNCAPLNR